MLNVIGIGDNVVDIYLHKNTMYPGGNALNFCAYAKKLGHRAAYIGVFGDDRAARHVMDTAERLGIDLSHARHVHGENGYAKVDLIDGDRTFMGSNKGGVMKTHPIALNESDLDKIRQFDLVHTSCFSYLDGELDKLYRTGVPISYDFSDNLDEDKMRSVCPYLFLGVGSCSHLNDQQVSDMARKMHTMGSKMALLSMGRRGAVLFDGATLYCQEAGKEKAVDSMGAGDSFLTGFATSYISRMRKNETTDSAIRASLKFASAFATETCMVDGAFGFGTEYTEAGKESLTEKHDEND